MVLLHRDPSAQDFSQGKNRHVTSLILICIGLCARTYSLGIFVSPVETQTCNVALKLICFDLCASTVVSFGRRQESFVGVYGNSPAQKSETCHVTRIKGAFGLLLLLPRCCPPHKTQKKYSQIWSPQPNTTSECVGCRRSIGRQ